MNTNHHPGAGARLPKRTVLADCSGLLAAVQAVRQGEPQPADQAAPVRVLPREPSERLHVRDRNGLVLLSAERCGTAKAPVAFRPSRSVRGMKVTERDRLILQFMCRYRFATYPQLTAQFDTSVDVMRRRMPKLQREGLVKSMTYGASKFLLWRVTEAGTELSGLNLTVPRRIAATTIRHDLGLVDLGIRFETAGEVVVTEREIRAVDTRNAVSDRMQIPRSAGGRTLTDAPVFAVGFGAVNGKQRGAMHIPDLVLVRKPIDGAPQSIAVELELHHKAPIRVRETLFAYKNATNIGAVVFYTDKVAVRNLINQAANDTGTTNIVTIRKWEPAAESGVLTIGI